MAILNYNESTYLQENPDVAQAVASGIIPNGFEHWVKFSFIEKRTPQISFNEQFYLDANPQVAAVVANGSFSSGFEHYTRFGAAEGRDPVASTTPTGSQLQEILKRGFVRVAVNEDALGFSNRESDGSFSGIGIDFSRAIATALFGNPNAVEFAVVKAGEDFNSVASGAVDIAATLPTQSVLRDASLGVDYSPTVFFDI